MKQNYFLPQITNPNKNNLTMKHVKEDKQITNLEEVETASTPIPIGFALVKQEPPLEALHYEEQVDHAHFEIEVGEVKVERLFESLVPEEENGGTGVLDLDDPEKAPEPDSDKSVNEKSDLEMDDKDFETPKKTNEETFIVKASGMKKGPQQKRQSNFFYTLLHPAGVRLQQNIGIKGKLNKQTGLYGCYQCAEKFRTNLDFRDHFDSIHLLIKYKCNFCEEVLNDRTSCLDHQNREHKRPPRPPRPLSQQAPSSSNRPPPLRRPRSSSKQTPLMRTSSQGPSSSPHPPPQRPPSPTQGVPSQQPSSSPPQGTPSPRTSSKRPPPNGPPKKCKCHCGKEFSDASKLNMHLKFVHPEENRARIFQKVYGIPKPLSKAENPEGALARMKDPPTQEDAGLQVEAALEQPPTKEELSKRPPNFYTEFWCGICDREFATPGQCSKHRQLEHAPRADRKCDRPGCTYYAVHGQRNLIRHQNSRNCPRLVKDQVELTCRTCKTNRKYSRRCSLLRHMKSKHKAVGGQGADVCQSE